MSLDLMKKMKSWKNLKNRMKIARVNLKKWNNLKMKLQIKKIKQNKKMKNKIFKQKLLHCKKRINKKSISFNKK